MLLEDTSKYDAARTHDIYGMISGVCFGGSLVCNITTAYTGSHIAKEDRYGR